MKKCFLILLLLFFTGCSNYNDVNNIAVVSSIGIDFKDSKYQVFVNVLSSNQDNKSDIYNEECAYLNECFDGLNNKLMKRLYLTHLDLLILGDSLNKDNFDHIFNFFLAQKTSRNSFSVIISDNINEKILEYDTKDINNMLELSTNSNGLVKSISLDNIIKDILNYKLAYIPYLKNKEDLEISGYKCIYEEDKVLTKEDSIAINLIKNYLKVFSVMIEKEVFKLEECNTLTLAYTGKFNIKLSCKYKGDSLDESVKIENYLKTIINNFISENSDNYFEYLYYKYKNKYDESLQYIVDVDIEYLENTGGEMFE